MKTTVVIADALFERAQRASKQRGIPLRELFEEGLRAVLEAPPPPRYALPDCRVGTPGAAFPLAGQSWEHVRDLIYRTQESGSDE
jgi:hypothetical protein